MKHHLGVIKVKGEYRHWWGVWSWRYTAFCKALNCDWHTGSYPAWLFQRAVLKGWKHAEEKHT